MGAETSPISHEEQEAIDRLRPVWFETVTGLGGNIEQAEGAFQKVITMYRTGDGRAYHNLLHVDRMITVVRKLIHLAKSPHTLQAAIFGHDIVYVPGSKTNEAESADVFGEMLRELQADEASIDETKRLIMITEKHRADEDDIDAKLIVGGDFEILGSPQPVYDKYSIGGIYVENVLSGKVSPADYVVGRGGYLDDWTEKAHNNTLFPIPELGDQLNAQALDNFARERIFLATLQPTT